MLRLLTIVGGLALMMPGTALAKTVVLPPLMAVNADSKTVDNITSLVSTELSFQADIDDVKELKAPPPGLTAACLSSTACLAGVVKAAGGGDEMVAGTISVAGNQYKLDLVLFDAKANTLV